MDGARGKKMREILFRGQTRKKGQKVWMDGTPVDGEWVYGGVLQGVGDFSIIYGSKNQNDPGEDLQKWCVYTDTLCQFTGLTDKNGTKIFEGDIVDCWSEGVNAKGTVQQRKDGLWIIYPAWQKTIMWGLCPDEYCHTTVEVIGNIHDNPELLEVTDNA